MDPLPYNHVMRILVADDEQMLLDVLVDMLKGRGHTVVSADTGAKTIDYLEHLDFDLAILDWGLTGSQVMKQIREIKPELRIILISGYHDPLIILNRRTHWLAKPFKIFDLTTMLDSLPAAGPA
jgi:CheY-like chemotaxis protein